jgi:hypothetical protein
LKRKKLEEMIEFLKVSIEEMDKDEKLSKWTAEEIFETAAEVALNEFSARGVQSPLARVDKEQLGFCLSDDYENVQVLIIHGKDMFSD